MERKTTNEPFENDPIFKSPPEEIAKPSAKLATILGRYYRIEKMGIKKKKKYGKLKDAPLLLANLNVTKLISDFEDVFDLKSSISHYAE